MDTTPHDQIGTGWEYLGNQQWRWTGSQGIWEGQPALYESILPDGTKIPLVMPF